MPTVALECRLAGTTGAGGNGIVQRYVIRIDIGAPVIPIFHPEDARITLPKKGPFGTHSDDFGPAHRISAGRRSTLYSIQS